MSDQDTYTDYTVGVLVVAWIAFALYVFLWFYTLAGFVYVFSIRWFSMVGWIIRYGIPWLSPKILSIWVQLIGLAVRAGWILTMVLRAPVPAQYATVNFGFIIMISHIVMVLCFWADSLLYFVKKEYGMRRSEGFFNYHATRWTCVGVNVFNYTAQVLFFLAFLIVYYATDSEMEHPGLVYKVNLTFFSIILFVVLGSFLFFAFLIWRFIVSSGNKGNLLGYLLKVTGLLMILGVVETVKLGFLIYKLTVPGYGSGDMPYEVYLIFVFFIPDLVPTFIFTTLEFVARRRAVLKAIRREEGRYTKFARPTASAGSTSSNSAKKQKKKKKHQGFEELGEPFMRDDTEESINDL